MRRAVPDRARRALLGYALPVALGGSAGWPGKVWGQTPELAEVAGAAVERLCAAIARGPQLEQLRLSPDGRQFAALIRSETHSQLAVRALAGGPWRPLMATDNLEFQLSWLVWASPERLLLSLRYPGTRALSAFNQTDTVETRLLSLAADGSGTPLNLGRPVAGQIVQDQVVDLLPEDGEHILLAQRDARLVAQTGVYRVNLLTGARRLVQDSLPHVQAWLSDAQHRVRVGLAYEEGRFALWVCDPERRRWRVLRHFGHLDAQALQPLGFGLDPQRLYVLAEAAGRRGLYTLDLSQTEPEPQALRLPSEGDLGGQLLRSTRDGEALGLISADLGGELAAWDPGLKALLAGIEQALPGRSNRLLQLARRDELYLLLSAANGDPGAYLVGDRQRGSLEPLGERYPELVGAALPRKHALRLRARDGLVLQGFVSLPPGLRPEQARNLPLVVLPHGGPQAQDSAAFDDFSAYIALRGHAVLQLNFRGSTGQGRTVLEAGLQRWGLEMQDDLEDGVAELARRGWIDARRVAIVGASYGGYAALMGVAKTPRLYRGAMALAAPSDLVELLRETEHGRTLFAPAAAARQIGRLATDRPRLEATSPRRLAARIEVPVVLMHGTQDRQVPFEHSVWMAEALQAAGKPVRLLRLERGDHQLSHLPHRRAFFAALDGFLKQVLGPAETPARPAPLSGSAPDRAGS